MRQTIRKLIDKSASALLSLSPRIYAYPMELRVKPWFQVDGNNTLCIEHDLDENSIVFDVGGYEGHFASLMFSMYRCKTIHVFKPVKEYADKIKRMFHRNEHIRVHNFGLSDKNQTAMMAVCGNSSSLFKRRRKQQEVVFKRGSGFFSEHHITRVDMMKINIEGGEYELLNHLIETQLIRNILNIQVQFHDFLPNAQAKMASIQEKLKETHHLTYQYPFVWENWQLTT